MRKNLFFFGIIAFISLLTTGCYINMSDGNKETTIGNRVYKGEYVEKTEFGEYSAYVTVYVNQDTISEVKLSDNSKPVTSIVDWDDRPYEYHADLKKYLDSFSGKKVEDIKNYKHSEAKEENKLDMITGVSITSDRILQAVKNALSKI